MNSHGLPNEGQTYAEVLEASPTVGLHLLKVIAGRADGAVKFEAKTPAEKSAKSAAVYIVEHLPVETAAS